MSYLDVLILAFVDRIFTYSTFLIAKNKVMAWLKCNLLCSILDSSVIAQSPLTTIGLDEKTQCARNNNVCTITMVIFNINF